MASAGNSMSTTGPITRATRPTATSVALAFISLSLCSAGARSGWGGTGVSGVRSRLSGERVGTGHDLADLLGDLGLAGRVRAAGEAPDEVLRILGGGVHRLSLIHI